MDVDLKLQEWEVRIGEYLKYLGKDPDIAKVVNAASNHEFELVLFNKINITQTYSCYLDINGCSRSGSISMEDVIAFTDTKYMTTLRNETFHDYVTFGDFLSMIATLSKGL